MSNKPEIYGYCDAGCKWKTVHKDDFLRSASITEMPLNNGGATLEPLRKYKIYADRVAAGVHAQSAKLPNAVQNVRAATVGTKIYLFGGLDGTPAQTHTISAFDTEKKTISTLSEVLEQSEQQGTAAVAVGTKIYLFGCGAIASNSVTRFDTISYGKTVLSETISYKPATAVAVGANIYLLGGYDGSGVVDTIERFSADNEIFYGSPAVLPTAARNIAAVAVDTKIYIFGGQTTDGLLNTINVFDTETHAISTLSAVLPTAARNIAAVAVGTKIYLFGGYDANGRLNTINVFDTETHAISTLSETLSEATTGIAAVADGTEIYLFGGSTSSGPLDSVGMYYTVKKYTCTLTLAFTNGQYEIYSPESDEYKNYFIFEILALRVNDAKTELTIAYEVNGERIIRKVNGSNLSTTGYTLNVSNANAVYVYNTEAKILVEAKDGKTPYIGENGNWYIDDEDTGVSAGGIECKNALCIDSQALFSDSEYYVNPNEMVYVTPASTSAEIFIDIVNASGVTTYTKDMGSHITVVMFSNGRSCLGFNHAATPTIFTMGLGETMKVKIRCSGGAGVYKVTTQKMLEG